jgi:hypothetical protein
VSVSAESTNAATGTAGTAASPAQERAEYIAGYLELYETSARYQKLAYDEILPGIRFKLKNTGPRTLEEVEVSVFFKDAAGNVISEKKFYPVRPSENEPLKPGFIWQMEPNYFYSAKNVPSEWKQELTEFRITDIRFSDKPEP